MSKTKPLIFRFSIEASPPDGADAYTWSADFMAAIITAMRDKGGSIVIDDQGNVRYSIEQFVEGRKGLH